VPSKCSTTSSPAAHTSVALAPHTARSVEVVPLGQIAWLQVALLQPDAQATSVKAYEQLPALHVPWGAQVRTALPTHTAVGGASHEHPVTGGAQLATTIARSTRAGRMAARQPKPRRSAMVVERPRPVTS
jgi:hypothetical protein